MIERLCLTQFRNHIASEVDTDCAQFVCLLGDNGAGKTNILEAISLLSPGRGLRRATYDEMGHHQAPQDWSLLADIQHHGETVRLGTGRLASTGDRSRQLRIDGETARTTDELLDYLRVLWLTPAMDGLFTGPEADRRRFLDRMVLAIDPGHGKRVSRFEAAMKSRNRLLETPGWDAAWLSAVESELVPLAVAISEARRYLLSQLRMDIQSLGQSDDAQSFPTATLELGGVFDQDLAAYDSSLDAEDAYAAKLADHRYKDQAAGRTLIGPHRAELSVVFEAKSMPAAKCSTGEQKALLLGLVLAHAKLVARVSGIKPILLLDEVAAHLDQHRRAALFAVLSDLGGQVWMTGTDAELFAALPENHKRFDIVAGAVQSTSL